MKSLYFKVLVWFLATVLITGVGLLWVGSIFAPDRTGPPPFRRPSIIQLDSARKAYESGGAEALRDHLALLRDIAGIEAAVTDNQGKDLVTGEDLSGAVRRIHGPRLLPLPGPVLHSGRPIAGLASPDGKYFLLSLNPMGPRSGPPFLLPAQIWVFISVGLLVFGLAYYVTAPVRQLRDAVEQFGAGNLTRRVDVKRSDELGQLASSFNAMAGRIEHLVDSQRRLLMDMSHELRSPLTRLGLAVELAREGGDTQSALDRTQREADRLNTLVAGLLLVTRGEADPAALRFERLDLNELLGSLSADARLDAEAKGCSVRYSGVPAGINGDEELLRRAVENVLRNAIRHTPEGSAVDISLEKAGAEAVIKIRDQGPGVPPESLPLLFDAFYRAAATGGFGLGLSIAQRAVALHRGTITAVNASPGLLVTLRLPL